MHLGELSRIICEFPGFRLPNELFNLSDTQKVLKVGKFTIILVDFGVNFWSCEAFLWLNRRSFSSAFFFLFYFSRYKVPY